MAYFDEKKHASDVYRAQADADPARRAAAPRKSRSGVFGWIAAAVVVAALAIGIGSMGDDDAGAPPAMAPAESSVAPDAAAPATGTQADPATPAPQAAPAD